MVVGIMATTTAAPTRDIWSDIGNFFGNITGVNASNQANQNQKQAMSQIDLANSYGTNAAGVYSGLRDQGNSQQQVYQNNFLGLLNREGAYAGLGPNTVQPNPTTLNSPPASGLRQPNTPGEPVPGQQQADPNNNPYQLDTYQQQQLNQTMAGIAQAQKTATASAIEQLNQRGITDPRTVQLVTEQLNEHFADLQAQESTKFYEQVKTDKEQALQSIITQLSQYGQQGISEQEAAGSGFTGLAGGAASLGQAQQNLALQQQQTASSQAGNTLSALAFALNGGFGAGATAPLSFPDPSGGNNVTAGFGQG